MNNEKISEVINEMIRERVLLEWDVITESDWFRELVKELVKESINGGD